MARKKTSWVVEVQTDLGDWQTVDRFDYRLHMDKFLSVCKNYQAYWNAKYQLGFKKFRLVQEETECITLLEEILK